MSELLYYVIFLRKYVYVIQSSMLQEGRLCIL
jgi:hypothetical protein